MEKLRGWRGNLLLLVVTLIVSAVALEAATRWLGAGEPPLLVLDPVIGKRFRADFRGRVYVAEAGQPVDLRFNHEGLRGPDWPRQAPAGTRRLAVLGDSMIAAIATDEDKTLVRRLEDGLNTERVNGSRWEVLNFGVSSSSTGNELVLYREVARRYHPDVVLCAFFTGNDLADNSSRLTQAPRIYFELDEHGELRQQPFTMAASERAGMAHWLDANSRFYAWQKTALREARGRARIWTHRVEPAHWIFARDEPKDVADAWRLTDRLLRAFRESVEADGARFAVVVLPCAEQIYDDLWTALLKQAGDVGLGFDRDHPEARLSALCREAGIPLITMTAPFRAAAPHASSSLEAEWLFFQGRWHFNVRGHQLAADVLTSALRSLLSPASPVTSP
jgi:hypothetical protein